MELFFFTYIKILFIGLYSKSITFKNLVMSLIPFTFLIFVSFFNTTITYKFTLYFIVILLSSMSFIKNKFIALNFTIYVLFIDIYILFIVYGHKLFYFRFNNGDFDITFVLVEIIIVIFSIWLYLLLSKLEFLNQNTTSHFEISFGFVFLAMVLFSTILIDLSITEKISLPIDSIVYLILMLSILVFLSGIVSSIMFENIKKKQGYYVNEISNSEENLSLLLNTMENQRIDYVHQLLINNDYDTATEYIDSYLENQTKNLKNLFELKALNNEVLVSFFNTKLKLLNELNFTVDIEKDINNINLLDNKYLLEILGIIIDNAIEASYNSNQKFILIKIYRIDSNTIIEITNSALQDDISNLNDKVSKKGFANRKNGLKLLDLLLEDSSLTIIKEINNSVTYKIFI